MTTQDDQRNPGAKDQLRELLGRDSLGTRIFNAFRRDGVFTVDQARDLTDADVLDFNKLGKQALRRVKERLHGESAEDENRWTITLIEEALDDARLVHDFQQELRNAKLATGALRQVFLRWQRRAEERLAKTGDPARAAGG